MDDITSPNPYGPLSDKISQQEGEDSTSDSLASGIGEKRKTLPSLDSDDCNSPVSKKINQFETDSSFESISPKSTKMDEKLDSIQRRLDTLATSKELDSLRETFRSTLSEQISKLTRDIDHWSSNFQERFDAVEGRMLEAESRVEQTEKENRKLIEELVLLKNNLSQTNKEINDQQQYGRRWNLRVFNVPELINEPAEQTTNKLCDIFSNMVGVPTSPEDIEVAHRVKSAANSTRASGDAMQVDGSAAPPPIAGQSAGNVHDSATGGAQTQAGNTDTSGDQGELNQNVLTVKPNPIIVRFKFRGKRDQIIKQRSNLKKKKSKISISEDLTKYNMNVSNVAYKHPATESTWSVSGKIFCKLKSGTKFVIPYGVDVNHFIRMKAGE